MDAKESIIKMELQASQQPFTCSYFEEALDEMNRNDMESSLLPEGCFSDLENSIESLQKAMQRLACISVKYHWNKGVLWPSGQLKEKVLRGVIYYCNMELARKDRGLSRFHMSIFRMPVCALNIYFALHPDLAHADGGLEQQAKKALLDVALQTFTLPERGDETDQNPYGIERFRGHVWWEGANALAYRPVFRTALAWRSEKMIKTLIEVSIRSLTPTSKAACTTSFWREGICADGFGWGHGRQSYNNGYPAEGVLAALEILSFLKGTAFEKEIKKVRFDEVIRFMEGIAWSTYKGRNAPMQTRNIFLRQDEILRKKVLTSAECALEIKESLLRHFQTYLSEEEFRRVFRYDPEAEDGIRYFWNNDALVLKSVSRYFYFNMASARCDGVEFAAEMGDKRNYFTADGATVFLWRGNEYQDAMGTWDVCHLPGVTERFLSNKDLLPETNWHGYRSIHPFAAGAADSMFGVAGFIFEKDGGKEVDGSGNLHCEFSREMLGVLAYKSCFIFGDTILFLGAGITDKCPEYGREIHTTVENTACVEEPVIMENENEIIVLHDRVKYGVYKQTRNRVQISHGKKMTHWEDLNAGNGEEKDFATPVLEIVVNHGTAPKDASYAYYVDTGAEEETRPVILENSIKVQAAKQKNVVQAIFFKEMEAISVQEDKKLWVSAPCALLLRELPQMLELTLCDGLQDETLKEITVFYGNDVYKVPMSDGMMTGKPVTVKIPLQINQ